MHASLYRAIESVFRKEARISLRSRSSWLVVLMFALTTLSCVSLLMQGDVLALDCRDSLIMGHDRLIAGIGLDDLLLVETDDVIVVAKKGESQKVKTVVEKLKNFTTPGIINATALEDIYTEGPVRIKIDLE